MKHMLATADIDVLDLVAKGSGEFRALLTRACNLRCPFCHHEGDCTPANTPTGDAIRWVELISEANRAGYADITFSGGEPLLAKPLLADILCGIAAACAPRWPDVTVVTNGVHMDVAFLAMLRAYPGRKKVNVSLHAPDALAHARATGVSGLFDRVLSGIELLSGGGIPVKLNAVVMRGINDRPAQLAGLIDLSRQMHAESLKLIPLIPHDKWCREHYVSADVLTRRLLDMKGAIPAGRSGRKILFDVGEATERLRVEITPCTCHLGCASCLRYRCLTVDPDFRIRPCFLSEVQTAPLAGAGNLAGAIRETHAFLQITASQQRNHCPFKGE